MSFTTRASSQVLVLAGLLLAGCAADGSNNLFTTGALGTAETAAAPEPKVDPACVSLVSRIEGLRKEGVADKIEKAAAKKYKMTNSDLAKADQLTKANADFQLRCSTIMPKPMQAQLSSSPSSVAVAAPPPTAKARTPKAAANTTNAPANSEN
jgi:hypothetical protein